MPGYTSPTTAVFMDERTRLMLLAGQTPSNFIAGSFSLVLSDGSESITSQQLVRCFGFEIKCKRALEEPQLP